MDEQKLREERINKNLNLNKLPGRLKQKSSRALGAEISNFIHHVFIERAKSQSLNWCFDNIKRVKIFLQIFHANESGAEIYKEEIAKNLSEYSYKTIAKIVDEGLAKGFFVLLSPTDNVGKDGKVKNIRPSEELITDFLNLCIEILFYIDKKKP